MRRRPDKRRRLRLPPLLLALLLVNIAVGSQYSRLTSLTHLRIIGSEAPDRPELLAVAAALQDKPFASVSPLLVESQVHEIEAIKEAQFSRNIFGRGILKVRYRRPVAQLANAPKSLIDEEGFVYQAKQPPRGLRQVRLHPSFLRANLTLMQFWPSDKVAWLSGRLRSFKECAGMMVHVDSAGRLSLIGSGAGLIELGGADALEEKLGALRKLLEKDPGLLTRMRTLNLTDPARPAAVPLPARRLE